MYFLPYYRPSICPSRFTVVGPSLACGEHALNGIALVFNELTTSALKYDALATDHGHIDIQWSVNGPTVTSTWREQGGPAVAGTPRSSGFGSKLLEDTVESQFKGALSHTWNPEGLVVQIDLPVERLAY